MLRLMLLRHAKAVPETGFGDHARALAARGMADAQRMGRYLVEEGLLPDAVLLSDALRTSETFGQMRGCFDASLRARADATLYLAHPRALLAAIHETPAKTGALLVIAHNPGLADFADALTGYGDRYAMARMRQKFPTCGLAVLDFDMEIWKNVATKTGRLERFVTPATMGGGPDD